MNVKINTPLVGLSGDMADILRLFFEDVHITGQDAGDAALTLTHEHRASDGLFTERWSDGSGHEFTLSVKAEGDALAQKRYLKRCVKNALYHLLSGLTGIRPPWGSLTGIRPTRLMYEALEAGMSREQARAYLQNTFDVSGERAALLDEIVSVQSALPPRTSEQFDLYIGIPFCTTRCSYCSFSSGELGDGRLVEPYLNALRHELDACAQLMRDVGMRVRAAYMGGGTPTSLSAHQLDGLIAHAQRRFEGALEWTVEAGRPDTIDAEKLRVLRAHGIGRISVNPQSFSDQTLKRIGRAHTARDTLNAYELARSYGFDDINMDLIAALPGETMDDFRATLDQVCALKPESVTVHTLAIKRGSRLHEAGYEQCDARQASAMVEYARERLKQCGYQPYYLYRQKYMAGNLENVGYALPGRACLYNVDNMEEIAPILAAGACSITKWLFPRQLRIERAPNVRNIENYIERVDEMIERKRALILSE